MNTESKVYLKKPTTKELRKYLFSSLRQILKEKDLLIKKGLIFILKDFLKSVSLANNLNDNFSKRFYKLIHFSESFLKVKEDSIKEDLIVINRYTGLRKEVKLIRVLKRSIEIQCFNIVALPYKEKYYNSKISPSTYYNYNKTEIIIFDK